MSKSRSVTHGQLAFPYLAIPVLLAIAFVDANAFDGELRVWMPIHPEAWVPWVLLFGMPHVLASWQAFADKDYLDHYGRMRIAAFVLGTVAATFALSQISPDLLVTIFIGSIVHHTIAQQFGMALSVIGSRPTLYFRLWKFSMVAAGACLYVMLYFANPMELYGVPLGIQLNAWFGYVHNAAHALTVLALIFGLLFVRTETRGRQLGSDAWLYLIGTLAMGPAFVVLFDAGYFAFAIALGRLIHEGAAWFIYVTHDANRNRAARHNFLYRVLAFTRIPVAYLTPLLAFGLGIPLGICALSSSTFWTLTVAFSLIHYHMEAVIWRKGRIHRQHMSFAAT